MPSFPIAVANVSASVNGNNTVVTNNYKTVAQAQTHGMQRGAVVRVFSYNLQNISGNAVNCSFTDSLGTTILGPFTIPANPGNWTERASFPGFLFETSRNTTNGLGSDLYVTTNVASNSIQCAVEWTLAFTLGRPAGA